MLQFALPWLLLLIPLPIIARRCLPSSYLKQSAALKIPFFNALQAIAEKPYHSSKKRIISLRECFAYFIWLLLVVAAAAPQWVGATMSFPQSGRDIFLAVDISGSMQIADMTLHNQEVNRLTAVKAVANNFITQRAGDRLGLILFGSKAYLQTPLTFDRTTLQTMLDDASIGLAGKETAIGDAIGLAVKHLQNTPLSQRVVILLTDGANNAGTVQPLEAARVALQNHVRIYTIGIGSDTVSLESFFGHASPQQATGLDIPTLQAIAQTTGGLFFRAKDSATLKRVYQTLDKLEPIQRDQTLQRPMIPLYPWPLALALLLSISFTIQQLYRNHLFKKKEAQI